MLGCAQPCHCELGQTSGGTPTRTSAPKHQINVKCKESTWHIYSNRFLVLQVYVNSIVFTNDLAQVEYPSAINIVQIYHVSIVACADIKVRAKNTWHSKPATNLHTNCKGTALRLIPMRATHDSPSNRAHCTLIADFHHELP